MRAEVAVVQARGIGKPQEQEGSNDYMSQEEHACKTTWSKPVAVT